jgi:hypothetical protein
VTISSPSASELEPVDDAAQGEVADLRLEPQLEADVADLRGVLHREVRIDERAGVVEERLLLRLVEAEQRELGIGPGTPRRLLERALAAASPTRSWAGG